VIYFQSYVKFIVMFCQRGRCYMSLFIVGLQLTGRVHSFLRPIARNTVVTLHVCIIAACGFWRIWPKPCYQIN